MRRPVRTSDPASAELIDAVRWYEERRPGIGGEFFDAVVETVTLIEASPEIGSVSRHDSRTRRMLVPRFPYQVVYRLKPTEIVHVAVGHLKTPPRLLEEPRLTRSPPNNNNPAGNEAAPTKRSTGLTTPRPPRLRTCV